MRFFAFLHSAQAKTISCLGRRDAKAEREEGKKSASEAKSKQQEEARLSKPSREPTAPSRRADWRRGAACAPLPPSAAAAAGRVREGRRRGREEPSREEEGRRRSSQARRRAAAACCRPAAPERRRPTPVHFPSAARCVKPVRPLRPTCDSSVRRRGPFRLEAAAKKAEAKRLAEAEEAEMAKARPPRPA